jgi:hypothetical protein
MKKPLFCLALCFMLGVPSLSMARDEGWDHHAYHGQHRGHGDHGRGWAPWVSAAVIGSSLYWANQAYSQPITVIAPPPPPVVLEAPRVAYFCQSSRQYYPYVSTCNMPWQVVPY